MTFPAELFERVFKDLLPQLQQNWLQRDKRRLPDSIKFARKYFERVWVADGSTLERDQNLLKTTEPLQHIDLSYVPPVDYYGSVVLSNFHARQRSET